MEKKEKGKKKHMRIAIDTWVGNLVDDWLGTELEYGLNSRWQYGQLWVALRRLQACKIDSYLEGLVHLWKDKVFLDLVRDTG